MLGVINVLDTSSYFDKLRLNANYGFYVNMGTFIKRLRFLIGTDNMPLATIYQLSPNEKLRDSSGIPGQKFAEKLKVLSKEFLSYLSTAHEQIPAVRTTVEFNRWNDCYYRLIDYLNWFSAINDMFIPQLKDEEGVISFYSELNDTLTYFETIVVEESIHIFNDKQKKMVIS